jgi:hypothetical protein
VTKETNKEDSFKSIHLWRWVTAVGVAFIALGSASEAAFLLRDMSVEVYSIFSNQYDYDKLAKINVGNTVEYVEDLVGNPQVSRAIDPDTTANYFYTSDYLLTLFYNDERIIAYVWVSLDEDFQPDVVLRSGEKGAVGDFVFADIPLEAKGYTLNDSRIVRYYLENLEGGQAAGLVDTYLGNVQYGAFQSGKDITELYQAEVGGSKANAAAIYKKLREQTRPNLYGRGNLPLEHIEKSVLSSNEFTGYFGNN